jgi:hypothetical protein
MIYHTSQSAALMFDMLPIDLLCHIIVVLNGGTVGDKAMPKYGYLYPGIRGGRELHYFKISRDAMTFWKHVCKYMRDTDRINGSTHDLLLSDNDPEIEVWEDPHAHDYPHHPHAHERYVPRHFYAGDPKPWIGLLCYESQ